MTSEPTVLECTLRIRTTHPDPGEVIRSATAAIGHVFLPDQFDVEWGEPGRAYENDRDHLLSELAACRREIVRLRRERGW
jgi:hypothetical protein